MQTVLMKCLIKRFATEMQWQAERRPLKQPRLIGRQAGGGARDQREDATKAAVHSTTIARQNGMDVKQE